MNYQSFTLQKGDVIDVFIRRATKVMVVSDANLEKYRVDEPFSYQGGYFTKSPACIPVPHEGRWHVIGTRDVIHSLARVP